MAPVRDAAVGSSRRDALPRGSTLNDYRVDRVLGSGGFGIVYLARHVELKRQVAIKEYLPTFCAVREGVAVHAKGDEYQPAFEEGLTRFLDEGRRLVEFEEQSAIVSCQDFFRANRTAYLVMKFVEGQPLSEVLRTREAEGRPFGQSDLLNVIVPLLEGLAQVHAAGVIHRDIKPGNIMIRKSDGQPVLLDFGAAKQGVAELTKSMAPYTEGYAAFEQVGEGKLGPWTDIYAVGAVMWRMVAGGKPPWEPLTLKRVKAERRVWADRSGADDPLPPASLLGDKRFSSGVLTIIENCLRLQEAERIQSCGEILPLLRTEASARQGNARAQHELGSKHEVGDGIPQDFEEAAGWYRRAAEKGHAEAQYALVNLLLYGIGVKQDYVAAATWCRKAADQGHAGAQYTLGEMYSTATGVPYERQEAAPWYQRAAAQGHAGAQYALGSYALRAIYATDYSKPRDEEKALEWFQKAAMQGHVGAQYAIDALECMSSRGGLPAPGAEGSEAWYRGAAEKGHPEAQCELGSMCEGGDGVPQDFEEAAEWYRRAAVQGDVWAQANLGTLFANGTGVPQDDIQAYAWLNLSAPWTGSTGQDRRDHVWRQLTPEQLIEAARLSHELLRRIPLQSSA